MKNQDWRERFDKSFLSLLKIKAKGQEAVTVAPMIQDFIESELQAERERVKKEILDGLPKERVIHPADEEWNRTNTIIGFNDALSEVKRLIENL